MALTGAEKSRRYRERKREREDARIREERGLPPPPAAGGAPQGSYQLANGRFRAKVGWYRRIDGLTFARIPAAIAEQTYYSISQRGVVPIPEAHARYRARQAERPPMSAADELAGLDQ